MATDVKRSRMSDWSMIPNPPPIPNDMRYQEAPAIPKAAPPPPHPSAPVAPPQPPKTEYPSPKQSRPRNIAKRY